MSAPQKIIDQSTPTSPRAVCRAKAGFKPGVDQTLARLALRDGLELMLQDFRPAVDTVLQIYRGQPPIHFGYVVRGEFLTELVVDGRSRRSWRATAGCGGVMFLPHGRTRGRYAARRRVNCLALDVSTELLGELIGEDASALPGQLGRIAGGRTAGDHFIFQARFSARLAAVLHEIINIPWEAPCAGLYAEAKVLELISLQLEQLIQAPSSAWPAADLDQTARRGISRVRDMLTDNLQAPPSLADMSREAGMSHVKLNRCFKQMYGQTVFEYLRQARLDEARRLLCRDSCSLAEAAQMAGFSDQSHLNRCFKRHFGVTPGLYRRGRRA